MADNPSILNNNDYSFQDDPYFLKNALWERLKNKTFSSDSPTILPEKLSPVETPALKNERTDEIRRSLEQAETVYKDAVNKSNRLLADARIEMEEFKKNILAEGRGQAQKFLEE